MLKGYVVKMIQAVVLVLMLDLLVPAKQYKKYFDMCAGFIVIIIMLKPIVGVVTRGISPSMVNYSDMFFLDKRDLVLSRDILKHSDTLIAVYKSELVRKIVDMLKEIDINAYDVNIHINEDNKSDKFGEIKKLSIVVKDCGVHKDLGEEVARVLSGNLNIRVERIKVVVEKD